MGLGPAARAALSEAARIKDRRAMSRHIKHLANLLVREDLASVEGLLASREARDRASAARQHRVERWRDRLLAEGDPALAEFLDLCPGADRQGLRQLVRAAQRDQAAGRSDGVRRLFRALRSELDRGGA